MRIGLVFQPGWTNVNYRGLMAVTALRSKGHEAVLFPVKPGGRFDLRGMRTCDLVHVYRRAEPELVAGVEGLVGRGIAVTWDNDDDVRLLPKSSPQYQRLGGAAAHRDFAGQAEMIRRAHVVTTTSDHLADRYREAGAAEVARVENYLGDFQYARAPRRHAGFVIGWVAGLEHRDDAEVLRIAATLRDVMDRHPEVRVVTIGLRLSLDSARYEHHELVEFETLREHVRQFDVGIAPLADLPMSYARSNVKVKEYAGAGTPWLASARGPYAGLGPRQGGLLVEDDGWDAALEAIISSRFRRARLRRRAEAWGKSQSIWRNVGAWQRVFDRALERARAGGPQLSPGPYTLPR